MGETCTSDISYTSKRSEIRGEEGSHRTIEQF